MTTEKKPKGFQKQMEEGRRINLYLDQETIAWAKVIGNGNISAGIRKAADRIEQLERELAEAQKDADRYSWAICNPTLFVIFCNGFGVIDEEIDAAISEVKK